MFITKKQEPSVLSGRNLNFRFPFIDAGKKVGEGACGVVHRQVIAAPHLVSEEKGTENREVRNNHGSIFRLLTPDRIMRLP